MGANDQQIGGRHYKTEYEHWDLAVVVELPYLEGCATKYVSRWRKKNGLQDLEKALHYQDKLIETAVFKWSPRIMKQAEVTAEVERFAKANNLIADEQEYIHLLCTYRSITELYLARNILCALIDTAKSLESSGIVVAEPDYPGTPEDGGHHEQGPKEEG